MLAFIISLDNAFNSDGVMSLGRFPINRVLTSLSPIQKFLKLTKTYKIYILKRRFL